MSLAELYKRLADLKACLEINNGLKNYRTPIYLSNENKTTSEFDALYSGSNVCMDENGQKFAQAEYKDGLLYGDATLWYENGQKFAEAEYKDGLLDGDLTVWYENGQKESEYSYNKENKKDGKWTYWNEDGEITSEVIYKDGVCLSGDCPD